MSLMAGSIGLALGLVVPTSAATEPKPTDGLLTGVDYVCLQVAADVEGVDDAAIEDAIRVAVTLRLREARIDVRWIENNCDRMGQPYYEVSVIGALRTEPSVLYGLESSLVQVVSIRGHQASASLWNAGGIVGICPLNEGVETLRSAAIQDADSFLAEWLKQNPDLPKRE